MNKSFSKLSTITMLTVLVGLNIKQVDAQVTDIDGHWAEKKINQILTENVAQGYEDNTFRPSREITRAEFIKMVNLFFGLEKDGEVNFKDVNKDTWYYDYIQTAVSIGYIDGYEDGTFRPNEELSRQEAIKIVIDLINRLDSNFEKIYDFKDGKEVSEWAKPYVEGALKNKVAQGYETNEIKPKQNITRAEAVEILVKITERYLNIDTDGDGKPDLNIDIDGDKMPDLNVDLDDDGKADINIDIDNDGKAEINIDINKDGTPNINVDTDDDGIPNINIDMDDDGKADINIDVDKDGKPEVNIDTDKDGKPNINVDTDDDGIPNINVDMDDDGEADINIDVDKDGKPEVNIDTDKDGKPNINVDTDDDGIPNINVDTDKDGEADLNVDTDNDGKADVNIDTDKDWKPDINIDSDDNKNPEINVDIDDDFDYIFPEYEEETTPPTIIDSNGTEVTINVGHKFCYNSLATAVDTEGNPVDIKFVGSVGQNPGRYVVTAVATDVYGNTSTKDFVITVVDDKNAITDSNSEEFISMVEEEMIERINNFRVEKGISKIERLKGLDLISRGWSEFMSTKEYASEWYPNDNGGYDLIMCKFPQHGIVNAQNVIKIDINKFACDGVYTSLEAETLAEGLVNYWKQLTDFTHDGILNHRMKYYGFGFHTAEEDNRLYLYATQVFGIKEK